MTIWNYRTEKLLWMDAQVRKLENSPILDSWLLVVPDLMLKEEAEEIAEDTERYTDACIGFSNCMFFAHKAGLI